LIFVCFCFQIDSSDSDQINLIEVMDKKLNAWRVKLQDFGDDIASVLNRKNRGRGGYKFVFNVKHYGGFKFSSECAAETDAHGNKIPKISDGMALVRTALDIRKRDLYEELQSLLISPLNEFPHSDKVAAVDFAVVEEEKRLQAAQLAYQRKCADKEILAKKNADEKKRKRALEVKAALDAAAAATVAATDSSSDSSVGLEKTVMRKGPVGRKHLQAVLKQKKKTAVSSSSSSPESDVDDCSIESDGGFALDDYKGGENDAASLRRAGFHKPVETGDLDASENGGYNDGDAKIVQLLRSSDVTTMRNYILRGGQVTAEELSKSNSRASSRVHRSLDDRDGEWDDSVAPVRPSQLDGLTFNECEGINKGHGKSYLESNDIDREPSSEEDSDNSGVRAVPDRSNAKRGQGTKRRIAAKSKKKKKHTKPVSRGDDSDSSEDLAAILRTSSDSDVPKRKRKVTKSRSDTGVSSATIDGGEDKPRRTREMVGLTEQHVTQYSNLSLLPFQMTPAQRQSSRQEQFEVDGKMMSEDEIKSLILNDVDLVSKNLDCKFISFLRQHIMVDVFKDVHFMSNVIQFYRMKRFLHKTLDGDHIICTWQIVLKEVASDLINELVTSNQKIMEQMDKNLLDLKEIRRQQRHDNSLVIGSDEEKKMFDEDFNDLQEYKQQMKLSRKALEEIEKVMKRRINAFAHTTGAKIICIWAKLNGFQHLLRGQMSRFEKKFLMDSSTPFYSVLSDDLSRRWGNVVTSPTGLFSGIDLAGRNDTSLVNQSSEIVEGRVFEMDTEETEASCVEAEVQLRNSYSLERSTSTPSTRVLEDRHRTGRNHSSQIVSSGTENMTFSGPPSSSRVVVVPRLKAAFPQNTFDDGTAGRHSDGDAPRVRFFPLNEGSPSRESQSSDLLTTEEETSRQEDLGLSDNDVVGGLDSTFSSPVSAFAFDGCARISISEQGNDPVRPCKENMYTSALLSGSPVGGDSPPGSPPDGQTEHIVSNNRNSNCITPSVPTIKLSSLSSRFNGSAVVGGSTTSYLSSVSSGTSSSSVGSPTELCTSNAAVLFDDLKRMSQDVHSVDGMKRFIQVMNAKPPTVIMPGTKAEEDKILNKAKAKKKKEEAKLAAAAEVAKKAAALVTAAAGSSVLAAADDINFSSHDEDEGGRFSAAVRQKTDSYVLIQKIFTFICQKRVEVRDDLMNMQFFGQRMVRTLDNVVVLKFLLFLFRNKDVPIAHLVVYLMDERSLFTQLKCSFGIAYTAQDYENILGDGYCVLRSMFAMLCNQNNGYMSSAADMKAADRSLFKSMKTRREFFSFLNGVRESIGVHCSDELAKASDKKKLKTLMTIFATFPQLRQVPGAYWACLDWVAYAEFNCTAFSTNYSDCVTGYAQLHCSSAIRRDMSSSIIGLVPYSLDEIYKMLSEPVTPNFCVLEGQHAFVMQSPAKEDAIKSFKSVLGMFLGSCLQKVEVLCERFTVESSDIESILEKMIADNAYSLNESEAKEMSAVVQHIESVITPQNITTAPPDRLILCSDESVAAVITVEEFSKVRDTSGVIDLCDSDTGDVDGVKARASRAKTSRGEHELLQLKFKVLFTT
jgi:hypothetical protein